MVIDNNCLFYFDICIKFTLSLIISTMNNDNISLDVYLFMIKMCLRERKHSVIAKFTILKSLKVAVFLLA